MKKFLKVFLLCMAVLTVLTVAVSAATPIKLYADGVKGNTVQLDSAPEGKTYTWMTPDAEYIFINPSTGFVEALKAKDGDVTVYVMEGEVLITTYTFPVVNRTLTGIEVTKQPDKVNYVSGEKFTPEGMVVTAVYDNEDREVTSNYTCSPDSTTALEAKNTKITVSVKQGDNNVQTADVTINVAEVAVKSVELKVSTTTFIEGDALPTMTVTVKWNDNKTEVISSGYDIYIGEEKLTTTRPIQLTDAGKKIKVFYRGEFSNETAAITVDEKWDPKVEIVGQYKKTYYEGEYFDWSNVTKVILKNGNKIVKEYTYNQIKDSEIFKKEFLSTDIGKTTFTWEIAPVTSSETYVLTISDITVQAKPVVTKSVVLNGTLQKTTYVEGEDFDWTGIHSLILKKNDTIVASYTSSEIKEIKSLKYTFADGDAGKTKLDFSIEYDEDTYTFEVKDLTVTAAPNFEPDVARIGSLNKTTYKVGDILDWSGVTSLVLKNKATGTIEASFTQSQLLNLSSSSPLAYQFKESDLDKTAITIEFTATSGNVYEILISGLTIRSSLGALNPAKLTALVLDKTSYPVGYTFNISDIYYVQYALTQYATNSLVAYESDLVRHTDFMSLEVLTAAGTRKADSRQAYRNIIEATDVYTNNGERVVNVRFYMKDIYTYVDTRISVQEAAVSVTYQGSTIGTYDTIDDAVIAVNALSTTTYPVTGSAVVIKLNKDQQITTQVKVQVNRYIDIDLNGNQLTFYTNTVNSNMGQRYLTISNSSTTNGKFVYYSKSTTLNLKKGESFYFYNNYDAAAQLPGFYTVELAYDSTGKVTSTPSATSKKVVVGHGNDISLTITPNTDYYVSELKVDNTKYTKSNTEYTEKANNVVAFVYRVVEDCDISIKFTKEVKVDDPTDISDWENPFTDVSSYATYYEAVAFVNKNGIFQGTSTTKFSPSSTMTRAMFVTVLGRLAGIDASTAQRLYGTTSKFTDVSKSDPRYDYYSYAVPYIAWATQNGLIEGHGGAEKGTFGPEDPITHQQMYVIMQRYANSIAKQSLTSTISVNLPYTDKAQIAEWAEYAVKVAYVNDYIITTSTNRISPTTNATRAELAMLIEKFAKNVLEWGVAE